MLPGKAKRELLNLVTIVVNPENVSRQVEIGEANVAASGKHVVVVTQPVGIFSHVTANVLSRVDVVHLNLVVYIAYMLVSGDPVRDEGVAVKTQNVMHMFTLELMAPKDRTRCGFVYSHGVVHDDSHFGQQYKELGTM